MSQSAPNLSRSELLAQIEQAKQDLADAHQGCGQALLCGSYRGVRSANWTYDRALTRLINLEAKLKRMDEE